MSDCLLSYVAVRIVDFVAFEVGVMNYVFPWFGLVSFIGGGTFVAMLDIEMVVNVAMEVGWAMEPWTGANEDAA